MRTCVLAGGVGSGRFCAGLVRAVDPTDVTIVVNTGDDERIRGLHICPDIDTVLYHLAGLTDWARGWGLDDESFIANDRYRELAAGAGDLGVDLQEWFALGDRDLATHLFRTCLLDAGVPLSRTTEGLCRGLGVRARVLPMSDDPVRTVLHTEEGERLDFQEYFVRRRHRDTISRVSYEGADTASPAPGVVEAIRAADLILIPPSNPMLSVGPVLAVGGIREALDGRRARCIAISPIVGGKAIKGPADRILASFGKEASAVGVAELYRGMVDVFVVDETDRAQAGRITEMSAVVLDTIMSGPEGAARLAKEVVDLAR